ncbi:hypothetical protein [Streptomyces sp. NBC_00557]|nr:hypothetical protein [Streptomyces sp. NBC_00557]WUC36229.1 hypothetical protein OG956_19440 [Streptomyces sp. NBC_00557]
MRPRATAAVADGTFAVPAAPAGGPGTPLPRGRLRHRGGERRP